MAKLKTQTLVFEKKIEIIINKAVADDNDEQFLNEDLATQIKTLMNEINLITINYEMGEEVKKVIMEIVPGSIVEIKEVN